jgi:hypothetical protein
LAKMTPPNISPTPPAEELTEMAASNANASGVGATSNGGAADGISSTLAKVTSTAGVIAGLGVLMAIALTAPDKSPNTPGTLTEPTPIITDPAIFPNVPCPDSGSAMFTGYKMSNTSENGQLLLVTLVELPENLELFLTNSFGLPTASDEFFGNQTASAKV